MTDPVPERVRVTGPPLRAGSRRPRTSEIDDQTLLGSVLMGSLVRSQLRLAMWTLLPLLVFAVGVPLTFHVTPGLADVRALGVPLAWLVLGGLVYPFLGLLGHSYVRRAERNEQDFAELVDIAERPPAERPPAERPLAERPPAGRPRAERPRAERPAAGPAQP